MLGLPPGSRNAQPDRRHSPGRRDHGREPLPRNREHPGAAHPWRKRSQRPIPGRHGWGCHCRSSAPLGTRDPADDRGYPAAARAPGRNCGLTARYWVAGSASRPPAATLLIPGGEHVWPGGDSRRNRRLFGGHFRQSDRLGIRQAVRQRFVITARSSRARRSRGM